MRAHVKSVDAAISPGGDPGSFELLLSDDSLDRDGEHVWCHEWVDPLPESIRLSINHSKDVRDTVGSGTPWIDADGSLKVSGVFADTELGQYIRRLVAAGHIKGVSVEYLRRRDGMNELCGGSFVGIPANRNARVLSAKSAESF